MHYLNAVLVKLDRAVEETPLSDETRAAFHLQARQEAEAALRRFKDEEYDWYSPDDAGRWSDYFPPVLLGAEDKARFLHLLEQFAEIPIAEAKYLLLLANTKEQRNRTQEELDNTPGVVVIEMPDYPVYEDRKAPQKTQFWSGIYDPLLPVNNDVIEALSDVEFSEAGPKVQPVGLDRYYHLQQAIAIANGKFTTGCGFYSALDKSPILYHENRKEVQREPERFALAFFDLHI